MAQFATDLRSIEQSLNRDEDPSDALNRAVLYCKEALRVTEIKRNNPDIKKAKPPKEGEEPDQQDTDIQYIRRANYFVQKSLPVIVRTLMTRKTIGKLKQNIVNFFKNVLELVLGWIEFDDLALLKVLIEILDEDAKFYYSRDTSEAYRYAQNYNANLEYDAQPQHIVGEFATTKKYGATTVPLLVELINYFGELGGFAKILERIANTEHKIPVNSSLYYLKTIDNIGKLLKDSFLTEYTLQMKDRIFSLILGLDVEELKTTPKTSIISAIDFIHNILGMWMRADEVGKIVEQFQLDVALKCLHSPALEKRLQGLNGINTLIAMTARKETVQRTPQFAGTVYGGSHQQPRLASTKWLTSNHLLQWLDQSNIIDELFGTKMHHELLKRSNELFKFLAQKNVLTKAHIDLLWSSCSGKQEAVVSAIYKIFHDLVPHFSEEYFDHLLKKIQELAVREYDTNLILLLNDIAESCILKSIDKFPGYPLELLWLAVQDDSGVTDEVFNSALSTLYDLFIRGRFTQHKGVFVQSCVSNLKEHKSVPQSLEVLQKIFGQFPKRVVKMSAVDNRETVIEETVSTHNLLELFFLDIEHYHNIARQKSASLPRGSNVNEARLVGGYKNHLEHLKICLEFLQYIATYSTIPLGNSHMSSLWDCMIEHPLSVEEQNLCFDWLCTFCENWKAFDELILFLFSEKLMKLDFTSIHESGFRCFESLFQHTNTIQQKLIKDSSTIPAKIVSVADKNLTGLECFWEMALTATDEIVANQVVSYLVSLYDTLATGSQDASIREDFINTVMQRLEQATSNSFPASSTSAQFRVERCLILLTRYVEDYDTQQFLKKARTTRSSHNEPTFHVSSIIEGTGERFEFLVYRTNSVLELSEKLARHISHTRHLLNTPNELQAVNIYMTVNKKHIGVQDYPSTLQQAGITEQTTVHVRIVEPMRLLPPVGKLSSAQRVKLDEDPNSPRYFLSHNTKCFQQLYNLLDFSEAIGEKVWELVSELPINQDMHQKFSSINAETNWADILPTRSTLQLLYSLAIIEAIISQLHSEAEDIDTQAAWCSTFIKSGGFDYVYRIVLQNNQSLRGSLRKHALETLLKIINTFMLHQITVTTPVAVPALESEEQDEDTDGLDSSTEIPVENVTTTYQLNDQYPELNYRELVEQLLHIIWTSAKDTEHESSVVDGSLVKQAGLLLIACIQSKIELLSVLLEFPKFPDFVRSVLLETSEESIRSEMTRGIYHLCTGIQNAPVDPQTRFVPLLVDFLGSIQANSQYCTEYFHTLNLLVQNLLQQPSSDLQRIPFNEHELAEKLITLILEHPIVEKDDNPYSERDLVLIGMMNLLETIFIARPEFKSFGARLISPLFESYLFEIPRREFASELAPPKCKSKESRKACFALLKVLSTGPNCGNNLHTQLSLIQKTHLSQCKYTEWNYCPALEQRSPSGYVGIKNLGCICYMNSLLQQLFMMPRFRRGILALDELEDSEENPLIDNLIFQMQAMFSYLQESQKECYNPMDFCKANKDYDGQPTDVSVQMDADEFFNMLCEKIENTLKKTKQEKLLKDIWCGNMCSQLICKECNYISERDEAFFTVSLDIKNRSNIIEALEFYVQGETLTGDDAYFCEKCDKKVDALMRRCLKTLPSTLILHLKRFEFNYDTMRKLKLNDYCEFPNTLNMKPYTKEGLLQKEREEVLREAESKDGDSDTPVTPPLPVDEHPDEYYDYTLVGILVHRGVADSGHYYSFIKMRGASGQDESQWLEFNDEVVKPFDTSLIENECFGGKEDFSSVHELTRFKKVARTRSAYMLIYERNDSGASEDPNPFNRTDVVISKKLQENFSVAVPTKLFETVWRENVRFLMDKKVFDSDYFSFTCDLLCANPLPESHEYMLDSTQESNLSTFISGTTFFLQILTHSKEKTLITKYTESLLGMMRYNLPACLWLLRHFIESPGIKLYLLECSLKETRVAIAKLLYYAVTVVLPHERAYMNDEEESDEDEESEPYSCGIIFPLLDKLLAMIRTLPWYWRTFSQYFSLLRKLCKLAPELRHYLVNRHLHTFIFQLIHYGYTGQIDPHKVPKMGDKFESPNFQHAVGILSIIVRNSVTSSEEEEEEEEEDEDLNPYAFDIKNRVELSPKIIAQLQGEAFLKKLIADKTVTGPLCKLLCFWVWEYRKMSDRVLAMLKSCINDAEFDQLVYPFKVLIQVTCVKDSLQAARVDYIMESLLTIVDKFKKYPKFTKNLITYLNELISVCDVARLWREKNRVRFAAIDAWMNNHAAQTAAAARGTAAGWTGGTAYPVQGRPQQRYLR